MHPEVVNANTTRKQIAVLYMKEITIYFLIALNRCIKNKIISSNDDNKCDVTTPFCKK